MRSGRICHRVHREGHVLDRHEAADDERDAATRQPELGTLVRPVRPEQIDVDSLRHVIDRPTESRGKMLGRPAVRDERVGALQIRDVTAMRHAGQIDDRRDRQPPQPCRLIERVRMHHIGRPLRACDAMPRGPAEPFFVRVQCLGQQSPEPARLLVAIDQLTQVRRPQHDRRIVRVITSGSEQRTARDDRDLVAGGAQRARPCEMTGFAAAMHHAQAAHEHRYAHGNSSTAPARSTCWRAHSSRHTSAQMRFA